MRWSIGVLFVVALGCRKDWAHQDLDNDGASEAEGDCGPGDPLVGPAAVEVCDGRDNNCDGAVDEGVGNTWYTDADGDGFGDEAGAVAACVPPSGAVAQGGDCDDADPRRNPGAVEACELTDDFDCDGVGGGEDGDGDGFAACVDCDDDDADANPDAEETCDPGDQDCDGEEDEDAVDADEWYADLDGDGAGSDRIVVAACEAPEGFVADADDCDDLFAGTWPGASEACDGRDNDCNGTIDDGATGTKTYWLDVDKDGYGDPNRDVDACAAPAGHVDNALDCDDGDARYNPGATESCSDPNDYNCDGAVGQADGDGDGTPACSDCDDTNAAVEPGALVGCDGLDNDCNGQIDETAPTWYADVDGDGHGGNRLSVAACVAPSGYVATSGDCDDLSATAYPGATEVCDGEDSDCSGAPGANETDADGDRWRACDGDCDDTDGSVRPGAVELCDGADDDCDGTPDDAALDAIATYTDADGDGVGTGAVTYVCALASGQAAVAGDCDDADPQQHPSADEVCNGDDDDCDGGTDENAADAGTWYADGDGDGWGAASTKRACSQPSGYASVGGDCNDANKAVSPSADELCSTAGVDDDCDGSKDESDARDASLWFQDGDGDGHGRPTNFTLACTQPSGRVAASDDCDDGNKNVYGGATETWYDGIDGNCDGKNDFDQDGDGYLAAKFGGNDCDDTNKSLAVCAGLSQATAGRSCNAIKTSYASATSGVFWIDPDNDGNTSDAYETWCDMTRDSGGWTLVLNNVMSVGGGYDVTWAQATTQTIVRAGSLSAGIGGVDYMVQLRDWGAIGTRARIEVGSSAGTPNKQAFYDLVLTGSNYTLNLSNPTLVSGGVPGIASYHNGWRFATFDNDVNGCAAYYRHGWWYNGCWSGSFWAGTGHQQAAYWDNSSTDYWQWGAIWLR